MTSLGSTAFTIQHAVRDGHLVTLAELRHGEAGLMCYICGDRIVVQDGRRQFAAGKGRRNRGNGKHFSHTSNSRCHGTGPAHYQLQVALCTSVNLARACVWTNATYTAICSTSQNERVFRCSWLTSATCPNPWWLTRLRKRSQERIILYSQLRLLFYRLGATVSRLDHDKKEEQWL